MFMSGLPRIPWHKKKIAHSGEGPVKMDPPAQRRAQDNENRVFGTQSNWLPYKSSVAYFLWIISNQFSWYGEAMWS